MEKPPPTEPAAPPPRGIGRFFEPVRVAREVPGELAALAERGSLVFVMRSSGLLNFLYLRWLLHRHGLPRLRAAQGYRGIFGLLSRIRRTRRALEEAVGSGHSSVLFLGERSLEAGPVAHLVRMQRSLARPVFLVPVLLLWSRRAQRLEGSVWDVLFGTPDQPRAFANAVTFLRNFRRSYLSVGTPLDLKARIAERPQADDASLARAARGALHRHLARELRGAVGPPLKGPSRVRARVLRDRALRARLAAIAAETGRTPASIEAEAGRCYAELASNYDPKLISVARVLLSGLFRKLYDSVEVDEDGLAKVKRAGVESPLIFCPSHKSYIDFLVISWLVYERGMMAPHVAAGINLAFWPFGALARRGGAYFIRRQVKGDLVYAAVLRAYVKQLLRDRFPQEFYIEGGRSRTGKLLFPKMGLVSMEADAWLDGATDDVLFVPVAIDYEQLIEASSYLHELSGGEKKKETLGGLLGAFGLLFRRYQRLYVQFETPVSLKDVAQARLGERTATLATDGEARRQLVQAVANRVAYGIAKAVTVTPVGLVSAVLLARVGQAVPAAEVARRVELLRFIAAERGARFGRGLAGATSDPRRPGPVADALRRLVRAGHVEQSLQGGEPCYLVPGEKRPLLDYHRSAAVHRFVAPAIAASAVLAAGPAPYHEVRARAAWLSRLFKLEFMFEPGVPLVTVFEQTIGFLQRIGALQVDGERVGPGTERDHLEFLAQFLRPFLEAYRLAAETVAEHLGDATRQALDRKTLVKLCLEHGRAGLQSGRITTREAVSKATLENAVEWLVSTHHLVERKGKLARRDGAAPLADIIDPITRHLAS